MAWFWKKKSDVNANDPTATAAVAQAQAQDQEWQRQAKRLRDEEKRLEKERAKAAKRELKQMKKQAKLARNERAKADKMAKNQAKAVLRVHKRERRAERKRIKVAARLRRKEDKRRRRLMRLRRKEERRRRKRLSRQAVHVEAPCVPVEVATGEAAGPLVAPLFKEDKHCKSCHAGFQRLPTRRRHHCRNCGESFCSKCLSRTKRPIPWFKLDKPQKVCFSCDVQVFNGMGGATCVDRVASPTAPTPVSQGQPSPHVETPHAAPKPEHNNLVRTASFQSEQPQDSPRTAMTAGSRSRLSFRLRPRSRRDTNSPKSKKNSLWTLPIRPLLKRKSSADQLRNRTWDMDLRIEKEAMLARQRQSEMITVTSAPQFATAS